MSVRTRVRVALVGCGRIAQVHCHYLRQLPQVEVVGACDLSRESRETFATRWQLPTFADVDELLEAAAPDAAHVVTPPATHAALAIRLLDAGLHVLVEKPMALTTAEADTMVAAAQRAGKHLTVDHNRWFDPVVLQLRALIDAGHLGSIVGVEAFQGAAGEMDAGGTQAGQWRTALPGGTLYDVAPHPAYLLRGCIGPVRDVHVVASSGEHGDVREVRAVVAGERALGVLTISMGARPLMNRLVVYGTAMTAEVNLNNMTLVIRRERQVPKVIGKVLPNFEEAMQLVRATVVNTIEFLRGRQRFYPGMGRHFDALYTALLQGAPLPVSAAEGREVVALLEQIWQQAGVAVAAPARRAVNA